MCKWKGVGRFEFTEDDCVVHGLLREQAVKTEDNAEL